MTVEEVYKLIEDRNKEGISDNLFQSIAYNEALIWFVEVVGESKDGKIHTVVMINSDERIFYPATKDILKALRTNYPQWLIDWFKVLGFACEHDLQDNKLPSCICKYYDPDAEPEMF